MGKVFKPHPGLRTAAMINRTVLTVSNSSGLDAAGLDLRRTAFHYKPTDDVTDEFDRISMNVVLLADEKLAGVVRLTPSPPSVLSTWSKGALDFSSYPHAADLSRAAIAEEFRALGLYKLLMAEAIVEARRMGVQNLFGVVALDHLYLMDFWTRLGAKKMGEPKMCAPRNITAQPGLPIHIAVQEALEPARNTIAAIALNLRLKGFDLASPRDKRRAA